MGVAVVEEGEQLVVMGLPRKFLEHGMCTT